LGFFLVAISGVERAEFKLGFLGMAEPESMRTMLERPISQLQTLSQALFSALSSGHLPDPPIAALAACDANLAEATRLARIHLLKQKRIDQLMDEVFELDAQLVEIVETLATGQRELQAIIEEGEERIESARKAQKCEACVIMTAII